MLPWIILAIALLRLAELAWAHRNTQALLARGGIEAGRGHYPLFVLLHGAWLAVLLLGIPWDKEGSLPLLVLFALLMLGRLWIIASLGSYWTTRIITLPGEPLIRRGPYRFLRHPNYVVVAGEIAFLPLAFGAWEAALAFSILNALLLAWRMRVEDRVLAPRRALDQRSWKEDVSAT